jgi:hypothetical protein
VWCGAVLRELCSTCMVAFYLGVGRWNERAVGRFLASSESNVASVMGTGFIPVAFRVLLLCL